MKIKLITCLAIVLLNNASQAADPAGLFSQELINSRKDEVWFVSSDERDIIPKGGYLFRFELDVNNDGQMEVFASTSLNVERSGEFWSVYKSKGGNEHVKIADSLFLGSDLRVKIENGIRKYSFYVSQKQDDGGSYLGYFWIDAAGTWHEETHELTDAEQSTIDGDDPDILGTDGKPDEQKIADKLNLGDPVSVTIKKILLAKYIQDPTTSWRDLNANFTLSQQYKDPADAADISSIASWQPPANP